MTQREVVLGELRKAGAKGVSARTFVYEHGITRSAAIVHSLRHDSGFAIDTVDDPAPGHGKQAMARYVLRGAPPLPRHPAPPLDGDEPSFRLVETRMPCGCVRAANGRSWTTICGKHAADGVTRLVAP